MAGLIPKLKQYRVTQFSIGLHRRLVSVEITMPTLPFLAICQCDGAERVKVVVTSVRHGSSTAA